MTVDLDELERLYLASTQGEWRAEIHENLAPWVRLLAGRYSRSITVNPPFGEKADDDIAYIAVLHNAAPELLRRARELERLRKSHAAMHDVALKAYDTRGALAASVAREAEQRARVAGLTDERDSLLTLTSALAAWRAHSDELCASVAAFLALEGADAKCKQNFVHEPGTRCACIRWAEACRDAAVLLSRAAAGPEAPKEACQYCGWLARKCAHCGVEVTR